MVRDKALEEAKRNQSLRLPTNEQNEKAHKNMDKFQVAQRKKSFSKFSIAGSEWGANIIDISFNNVLFPHVYYYIFAHHLCV